MSALIGDHPKEDSDYGSDFGEEGEAQLSQLLDEIEVRHRVQSQPLVLESIEEHAVSPRFAHVPVAFGSQSRGTDVMPGIVEMDLDSFGLDVATGVLYRLVPQQQQYIYPTRGTRNASVEPDSDIPDTRTPLERFRTAPKKPLSVTDLVSPAWCELQYWYTLTKFGRKKRTPAMKQGSAVHKKLEDEVHTAIPVDVQTREDVWGLRIWNIIQGLRTLRVTGMTRELEIWGTVDGQVVNGVIDELSYTCADPEFEAKVMPEEEKSKKDVEVPSDQAVISEFFKATQKANPGQAAMSTPIRRSERDRKIYLTDVKTRASASIPAGASLRPTMMQLMIYRRILSDLSSNRVNADLVFERYRLDSKAHFSDALIAQLGSLDLNFRSDSTDSTYAPIESPVDTVVELLTHNSLPELWQLMIEEFQITMKHGVDSISKVLRAEFRSQKDGKIIGAKMFVYGDQELEAYLSDEMKWWKGERDARGVDVEEAFKCRICEFAEECTWRATKVEDAIKKSRARTSTSRKSGG